MSRFSHRIYPGDKRSARRKPFAFPAWIDRGPSLPALACKIDDVSDGGARLQLSEDEPLPARFLLSLSLTAQGGKPCEVRWRDGQTVGIKYLRHPPQSGW